MILINATTTRPGEAPLRRLTPRSGTVVVPRAGGARIAAGTKKAA
ncbi:hypothetical protein [Streptacidiphilus cavernicola]|uniref:Uncharacterized protein n=1 Tax=Streptacidiphilus cavernicola TaxID=3342716 RepID=A0ABV6VZ72_9ACTN